MNTNIIGCCGHDCSRCITYLATIKNDDALRKQSQQFYKIMFGLDVPLDKIYCLGCRANKVFEFCNSCQFVKCAADKNLRNCSACADYPCDNLLKYQEKYVNKCNQITSD